MNRKYELLHDDSRQINGKTLYRIQATRDILLLDDLNNVALRAIPAGQKGGYVEHYRNLSQTGCCWIGPEACVWDNARVCDNALVMGASRVSHDAMVCGAAYLHDCELDRHARIGANSFLEETRVTDVVWIIRDSTYSEAVLTGARLAWSESYDSQVLIEYAEALTISVEWDWVPLYVAQQACAQAMSELVQHYQRCLEARRSIDAKKAYRNLQTIIFWLYDNAMDFLQGADEEGWTLQHRLGSLPPDMMTDKLLAHVIETPYDLRVERPDGLSLQDQILLHYLNYADTPIGANLFRWLYLTTACQLPLIGHSEAPVTEAMLRRYWKHSGVIPLHGTDAITQDDIERLKSGCVKPLIDRLPLCILSQPGWLELIYGALMTNDRPAPPDHMKVLARAFQEAWHSHCSDISEGDEPTSKEHFHIVLQILRGHRRNPKVRFETGGPEQDAKGRTLKA